MTAVRTASSDFPGGKKGDALTVELTVLGVPCLGLNRGSAFKQSEAFSFQIATENRRHGPVQQWHDVAKDGRRVGVTENDGGTRQSKEVELDGRDRLLLLANDLRLPHLGVGVPANCGHDLAHRSTSSLGGTAKGLRIGDFDLAKRPASGRALM